MILFVQYMVRFAFLYPAFKYSGFPLQLNEGVFAVFAFSFVFLAAGGYIINDYYDVDIDKVNKPEKVIIGNTVSPKAAYAAYWAFSILGFIMGSWASYKIGLTGLIPVFFIYVSGLWFYSNTLKYQFITGNLVVALLVGLVPFIAGLVELFMDVKNPAFRTSSLELSILFQWISAVAVFAFLSSLAREIVKDMEDAEGDKASGCRSIPIVLGENKARRIVQAVLVIMFLLLAYIQYGQWNVDDIKSVVYFSVFIQLPIVFIIIKMNRAATPRDFHKISNWLKILMVSGISYLFVFAYAMLHS